jgi:putative addiction module component (TIGR02574 family)
MNSHAEQILQSALGLDPHDRAEIAASLIRSLDDEMDSTMDKEVEAAWSEEIKRRIESIDKGEVQMIPWDEAIRSMRERLNG